PAEVPLRERGGGFGVERRREHSAAPERAHQLAALRDERQRILERERAGGDERGVLTEAVARRERRADVARDAAQRLETRVFVRQQRGLGEARPVQLAVRIPERELAHVVLDDFA